MKLFKPRHIILIFSLLIPIFLLAQSEHKSLFPFEQNGNWGYMDKNGKIIVQPKYQLTYPFKYERGKFKHKGKYGFVNHRGDIIIKPKYKTATNFSLNGAEVKKGKKTFRIDTIGNINNSWIMGCGLSSDEKCSIKTQFAPYKIIQNKNKFGLQLTYKVRDSNNQYRQKIDTINIEFDSIFPLHKGIIGFRKNGKFGFFDKSWLNMGAEKVMESLDIEFEDYQVFNCPESSNQYDNVIALKKDGLWKIVYLTYGGWMGYLSMKENTQFKYRSIVSREKDYLIVEYKENKYGYVGLAGKEFFIDKE